MKTICVVTGTRAEYGLLRPVIQKIWHSDQLRLQLLVTGAHLSETYGLTVREIEQDGVPIHRRIPILHYPSTPLGTAKTTGEAISLYADYWNECRPDLVLVLGDRYEIFAAGAAAAMLRIPLAHISGGDVTLGAADEFFRHSLTKMASLHFPSCAAYANRLVAMGEEPQRICCVGGLGDENIRTLPLKSKQQLAQEIGFDLDKPYILFTYHPETAGAVDTAAEIREVLSGLDQFGPLRIIFTRANADAGGSIINAALDEYALRRPNDTVVFSSMGIINYLSAMAGCSAVVGNSSSGVVEAPSLQVPTVNIGDRQKGRLRCGSIIDCPVECTAIAAALDKALSPNFAQACRQSKSPYRGEDTSGQIVAKLSSFLESELCKRPKAFFDIPQKKPFF